jgi:hypothetical protein
MQMKFRTPLYLILKVISISYPAILITVIFFLQNRSLESTLFLIGILALIVLFTINLFRYLIITSKEIVIFSLFSKKTILINSIKSIDIDITISGYPSIKGLEATIVTEEKNIDITNLCTEPLMENFQEKYPKQLNFKKNKAEVCKFLKSTTTLTSIFLLAEFILTIFIIFKLK